MLLRTNSLVGLSRIALAVALCVPLSTAAEEVEMEAFCPYGHSDLRQISYENRTDSKVARGQKTFHLLCNVCGYDNPAPLEEDLWIRESRDPASFELPLVDWIADFPVGAPSGDKGLSYTQTFQGNHVSLEHSYYVTATPSEDLALAIHDHLNAYSLLHSLTDRSSDDALALLWTFQQGEYHGKATLDCRADSATCGVTLSRARGARAGESRITPPTATSGSDPSRRPVRRNTRIALPQIPSPEARPAGDLRQSEDAPQPFHLDGPIDLQANFVDFPHRHFQPPTKKSAPLPQHPDEARKARVQGVVRARLLIDETGDVQDVEIIDSVPMLDEAVVEAFHQWTFEPARLHDLPVAVYLVQVINFSLQ